MLIPFRAHSAATLVALGADDIVMGPQAQLGPIDPTLTQQTPVGINQVSVEDVMAFIDFMQHRIGLSDQAALTNGLANLIHRVDAVTLGSVYRTHSHIRDVAGKIIQSRREPPSSNVQDKIISTLAEKVYAHGHAISLTEAQSLGLPVVNPSPQLEQLMWDLLVDYESHMKLLQLWDPQALLGTKEQAEESFIFAMIESTVTTHEYVTKINVNKQRELPQNLQVNINLNFQAPEADPSLEELLKQLQPKLQEEAFRAVQQALLAQAPSTGIGIRSQDIGWVSANDRNS